ncbi:MAG: hypothetical protein AB1422_16365 [bacterium]
MKKICIYSLLIVCLLNSKVSAEDFTWGSCTTYAPMPVLFIHGINSNMLTWEKAIGSLTQYFDEYRLVRFNEPSPKGYISLHETDKTKGVTYFKDEQTGYESPAKLYLEAFDYGGEDYSQSFKPTGSYQPELKKIIEGDDKSPGILKSYYGENYSTATDKLIIVGYSQGGLIAREYVQSNPDQAKHVKRLITIDTPHYGTDVIANLVAITMTNPSLSPGTTRNFWGYILYPFLPSDLKNAVKAIERGDVGLGDLLPHSNYLNNLNKLSVPENIEYICLVGKVIIPEFPYIADTDNVVMGYSQRAEKIQPQLFPLKPKIIEQKIPWDYIINLPG